MVGRPALLTRPFVLLCLATFLCYAHYSFIFPGLPLYISALGGGAVTAGLVLGAFSVVSFAARPLLGYATDRWSPYGVLLVGCLILGGAGAALALPWVGALFAINAVRGVGWGAINTAGAVLVGRLAPVARRGEASGYYTVVTTAAATFAPAVGLWLIDHPSGGFGVLFLLAGTVALSGALAALRMPPRVPLEGKPPSSAPPPRLELASFVDRSVLIVSVLSVCGAISYPATVAFVPLYARDLGIENLGVYFIASGVAVIVARLALGPVVDRGARGWWIAAGFVIMAGSLGLMALATTLPALTVAGILYGFGSALLNPALLALAMDRADPRRLGAAMATYSMSYRAGDAIGAPLAGALLEWLGFGVMFLGTIAPLVVGLALLAWRWRPIHRLPAHEHAV